MKKKIESKNLIIYCTDSLVDFSNNFIIFYNNHILDIKNKLGIKNEIIQLLELTDEYSNSFFIYGDVPFSGYYNDKGAFAYVDLNSSKDINYFYKGIIHELIHHLYKYYVYGSNNPRITWVDEGIAQYLSLQHEDLEKDKDLYNNFLINNLKSINLNQLKHEDKSFGNNNGYNLSYIAIRYLFENNSSSEILKIIKDYDKLIELGNSILETIRMENKNG